MSFGHLSNLPPGVTNEMIERQANGPGEEWWEGKCTHCGKVTQVTELYPVGEVCFGCYPKEDGGGPSCVKCGEPMGEGPEECANGGVCQWVLDEEENG